MIHNDTRDFIREEIERARQGTIIGQVVSVTEHTSPDDDSNIEANVIFRNQQKEPRKIPVATSRHIGHIAVPKPDDYVLVDFLNNRGQAPIITDVIHTDEQRAPLARPGHWRHEFRRESGENLYIEAEPADHSSGEPDVCRIGLKADGLSDPTTEIAVDDSGDTTSVRIDTDGDITLSAGGDIVIDQDGTAKAVATEDHVHSSPAGGETGTPDDVTKTLIE